MSESCWICGAIAGSSEHRFKKSDLVRIYGRGPYKKNEAPLITAYWKTEILQGPRAKATKYEKSLCHSCNSSFTQQFDLAYYDFFNWVLDHSKDVLRKRFIDFQAIYGEDFETGQRNLFNPN